MEEATYRGVSINATVSFTVPQAVAVAEAIERGLERREAEGSTLRDGPGLHDHGRSARRLAEAVAERDWIVIDPGDLEWAGVAVFKRAYQVFQQRGSARACCPPRSATTCTGASSSVGTS